MTRIDLYNLTPEELTSLIREGVKPELELLLKEHLNAQPQSKEFLTRKETAEFFKISLVCLHDWCKKGILIPLKMGNKTYFERSLLVTKLLDSNKNG